MTTIHPGGLPPPTETGSTEPHSDTARLATGLARSLKDAQHTKFYREARIAEKAEIASAMQHEIKHTHPLAKLKRRRRKPLVLNRQVRRYLPNDVKTARADPNHRRHERFGKDGRHQGGGQGQGEGQGKQGQKDGEQRESRPVVVKVGKTKAKGIDPAFMSSGVLAAVRDPSLPQARLEADMRRAVAAGLLDIAKQLPGRPRARSTAPVLGLSLDLNAALQLLRTRGVTPNRTGLAGAKQVLLSISGGAPQGAAPPVTDERARSLHLLAPLMVLGAERPSTQRQLALAENHIRSGLMAVGTPIEQGTSQSNASEAKTSQNS
jgi:hypothetical protein